MNNRKIKTIGIVLLLILSIGLLVYYPFRHKINRHLRYYYGAAKYRINGKPGAGCSGCDQLFNDVVSDHVQAYENEGISKQQTDKGLIKLEKKGVLKRISTNDFYTIRDMNHALPLLLPKAVVFLDNLSASYQKKCDERKLVYIPFDITSATRSVAAVERLQENNDNAIKNSPHLLGKTFDVSYRSFYDHTEQQKLFINALLELKKANACFVKYERNGCLHITVN